MEIPISISNTSLRIARLSAQVALAFGALLWPTVGRATCFGTPLSTNWVWTGDSRGGGSQGAMTSSGDTLTIAPVDHVFFTNLDRVYGDGTYCFKFKGSQFVFSWKITPGNPSSGTALNLQLAAPGFGQALALGRGSWSGFYYGWHNGSFFWNTGAVSLSPDTWHEVSIQDTGAVILATVDGETVDLFGPGSIPPSSFEQGVVPGYVGVGSQASAGVQFEGLEFTSGAVPTFPASWGHIKALYRVR